MQRATLVLVVRESPIEISDNEAYMLQRDSIESSRLETHYEFVKALAHGHRFHLRIPTLSLRAIADVGTNTGAWLDDVAQALDHHQHLELEFIGFDISPKHAIPISNRPIRLPSARYDHTFW